MRNLRLADGTSLPVLGQGTWMMGDAPRRRDEEIAALRAGIERGMTLLDTAEIYGDGASETLVGEAVAGRRDEVFLVSKVAPSNASRQGTIAACEASLRRLGVERLDLYLLHWRGRHPLAETLRGFDDLLAAGKIARWGVSNFDVDDMEELVAIEGGERCAVNQILYHPGERGVEFDLLPWLEGKGVAAMAYSPVGQGGTLLRDPALAAVGRRHGVSPAQVALAFAVRRANVFAIPKAGTTAHVIENAAAADLVLTPQDLAEIDAAFPPPARKRPLSML
ncbi:aldo/keto reductase [Aureimonas pseudogalii]|uniref:Diketogulonate reductase-like aldo/keto reductase n=1 Tax=Aureimonas pseudogalii TaxID=1744844 RepID=A0A7W6H6Y1_9HYPH|nr:aldo/keto reductase [Aureimonas pseudogalii]MBB3999578.1 diketogulonate reductase-like aldo/keto reductase [Aureimonas pseudogalii]